MKALLSLAGALLSAGMQVMADSISFNPVADTTIAEGNGARASGGDVTMIVGWLPRLPADARALLRFDLSAVPSNVVVTSATLTVSVTRRHFESLDTHGVYRLNMAWGETNALWESSGLGAWIGGSFEEQPDATIGIGDVGAYTFNSPALISTVQLWITNASTNHGWLLLNEDAETVRNARRFASRESGSGQPTLTIGYTSAPAPPPIFQIISLGLSNNSVVLTSTGTNGWLVVPEYSSNLVSSNWAIVPNYTNSFFNGTNVTIFDRLDPICGPNVFLRVRNTRN